MLLRRVRRVTPDCRRVGVSFAQRKSTLSANNPSQQIRVRRRSRTRAGRPKLARWRPAAMSSIWSLSGEKRTYCGHDKNDANDPNRLLQPHDEPRLIPSVPQFVEAQFRPEPTKVMGLYLVVSPDGSGRVIFDHFQPIDDFNTAFNGSGCSAG